MSDNLNNLSEQAQAALEAYKKMSESKRAYFSVLQAIDVKYKDGGNATEEEEKKLGDLLLEHDKCVTAFNEKMEKVTDGDDRIALIKCMSA